MNAISVHAQERAIERYGFELTPFEVTKALEDCRLGKAPCLKKSPEGRVHVATVRGKLMILCLAVTENAIITILPRDYFTSGRSLEHHKTAYRAKQQPAKSNSVMRRQQRRQTNRAIIAASMESGV